MLIALIKLVLELLQMHIIVPTIKKFKQHGFHNRGQPQTRGRFGGHEMPGWYGDCPGCIPAGALARAFGKRINV